MSPAGPKGPERQGPTPLGRLPGRGSDRHRKGAEPGAYRTDLAPATGQPICEVEGCPFVMDARHFAAWCEPVLLLDVQEGFTEGFSLPAGEGLHFVIRSPAPAPD